MALVNRRFNRVINQNRAALVQPHVDTINLARREYRERMWNASDARGESGDYGSDLDM